MNSQNKRNVICNIFSGGVNSIISVVWISIITRILGVDSAGIFTIAYASASLFLTVGYYGMRNFQVSDVNNEYNWREYHASRVITTTVMILISLMYVSGMHIQGKYGIDKCLIVIGVTLLKALDSYEDIYHGKYQHDGRLDIAGFFMGTRLLMQLVFMAVLLILGVSLVNSIYITFILGCILLGVFLYIGNKNFQFEKRCLKKDNLKNLLLACLPICISSFLTFFLNNMSKYVIDIKLNDVDQAYYGYISMPVFVVYLFANFIYAPMLNEMSAAWIECQIPKFKKMVCKAFVMITVVGCGVIILGLLFGIAALQILYKISLIQYEKIFLIILVGSVLYAYTAYFIVVITIIRKQFSCLMGMGISVLISIGITIRLIENEGLKGAAIAYVCSMSVVFLINILIVLFGINNKEVERG